MSARMTRIMKFIPPMSIALLAAALLFPSCARQSPHPLVETRVRALGVLPPHYCFWEVTADGARLAGIVNDDNNCADYNTGDINKEFDHLPVIHPSFFCIDGTKGPGYDAVREFSFSPDGQHYAYAASRGGRWQDFGLGISHYRSLVGGWRVVYDGKESGVYGGVRGIVFSPDSQRLAYAATRDEESFLVLDGKEDHRYSIHGDITFSPDSKRMAFIAKDEGGYFVVCDGKEGRRYSDPIWYVVFSKDSRHLAYTGTLYNRSFLVCDGEEGPRYLELNGIDFSPDGKHIAYCARESDSGFVVVDGEARPAGRYPSTPMFSPDSRRFAYLGMDNESQWFVCDGKETPRYHSIGYADFSPGGNLTFVGDDDDIVCDDRRLNLPTAFAGASAAWLSGFYDRGYVFSPDSRHIAFTIVATKPDGTEEYSIVIDGVRGPRHDRVYLPSGGVGPTAVRYVTFDKGEAWLVEVPWPRDRDWTHGFLPIAKAPRKAGAKE